MDPNAPGGQPQYPQQPPQYPPQYPPQQPQQPQQPFPPQPGAPQPQQQWFGSYPGQPGQYPPSAGMPGAFGVPPVPKKRSLLGRFLRPIIGIVVVAVIGIGVYAWQHQDNGKVLFSSTVPAAEHCDVANRVTEIKAGDHVYLTGVFTKKLDGDVVVKLTKDGQAFGDPITESVGGYDCLYYTEDLAPVFAEPGVYKVTISHDGEVVAEGSLTVK